MKEDNLYLRIVRAVLPSPFTIAIFLSLLTLLLALVLTDPGKDDQSPYFLTLLSYWQQGFWNSGFLAFTMQMALILVLGHCLALSPPVDRLIEWIARYCDTTARAALLISLSTLLVSMLNWGLCLVFGAVLVRKVGEKAQRRGQQLNYGLLGAAGYCGMMAWHGGFSGSAPLKVNESDHFLVEVTGQIGIDATLLSPTNLVAWGLLLLIIPALFYLLGKRSATQPMPPLLKEEGSTETQAAQAEGAERLDHARWPGIAVGGLMIGITIYSIWSFFVGGGDVAYLINLNLINFLLFGLALLFHGRIDAFLSAAQEAMSGATGILIQFPIYAGIMGLMQSSGLIVLLSEWFVNISTPGTFPVLTLFSAAIVNTFVPSGGGQWAVQGPVIAEAAKSLGVDLPRAIMALSYGDQLTNMLQPFWALPLLGITRLSAKDILPYSLIAMLVATAIFIFVLVVV